MNVFKIIYQNEICALPKYLNRTMLMNGLGQDQTPLLKLYLITTVKIKFLL